MIRALSIGVLAVTIALLVLQAALTTTTPASLSGLRSNYSFETEEGIPAVNEVSGLRLRRVTLIDAVMNTAGNIICAEEPLGNILHRYCEDEEEDEPMNKPNVGNNYRWARFDLNMTRYALSLPTPSPSAQLYALAEWDDLSIRR